mgnify:CR=1 FL=1
MTMQTPVAMADTKPSIPSEFEGLSLSVVIPAYNEEGAVEHTIDDVRRELNAIGIPFEIIVIDDGSSDRTLEIARSTGVVVDTNQVNTGYGASLKRGIKHAQYEYVAIIDAELHDVDGFGLSARLRAMPGCATATYVSSVPSDWSGDHYFVAFDGQGHGFDGAHAAAILDPLNTFLDQHM